MPNFEITAIGFDGDSDATDDRILWVSVPTRAYLEALLESEPYLAVSRLDELVDGQDLNFVLPAQDRELRQTLRNFSRNPP
jgi:hypothetical protein